jgi:hypothetical protein
MYCGAEQCDAVIDSRRCPGCSRLYPNPDASTAKGAITAPFGHAFANGTVLCITCWLDAERDELERIEDSGE